MGNIVVSADYFKELVEKATLCDVILAVFKGENKYLVMDIIKAMEGKRDGASCDSES